MQRLAIKHAGRQDCQQAEQIMHRRPHGAQQAPGIAVSTGISCPGFAINGHLGSTPMPASIGTDPFCCVYNIVGAGYLLTCAELSSWQARRLIHALAEPVRYAHTCGDKTRLQETPTITNSPC